MKIICQNIWHLLNFDSSIGEPFYCKICQGVFCFEGLYQGRGPARGRQTNEEAGQPHTDTSMYTSMYTSTLCTLVCTQAGQPHTSMYTLPPLPAPNYPPYPTLTLLSGAFTPVKVTFTEFLTKMKQYTLLKICRFEVKNQDGS